MWTMASQASQTLQLIDGSKRVLEFGGIHLHKFLSNFKDVMKALLDEDKASKAKDLNLLRDALPVDLVETTPDALTIPTMVSTPVYTPLKLPHATKSVYFDLETTGVGN